MRIDSGNIGMDSARLIKSSQSFRREVETHVSGNGTTGSQLTSSFGGFLFDEGLTGSEGEIPVLSETSEGNDSEGVTDNDPLMRLYEYLGKKPRVTVNDSLAKERSTAAEFQKMHHKFISDILELLFRKRTDKESCDKILNAPDEVDVAPQYQLVSETTTMTCCTEVFEYTSFSAKGTVRTDDGREINVDINISMSSRFCEYYSESFSSAYFQAMDPLVVNLHDVPEGLSDLKYFFDLDADGTEEEISFLKDGGAFLALDKNEDGKINDGSELFGTRSGDGFKDLAEYDLDRNGWIDENDEIFNRLKVWTFDSEGNSLLYSLKEAGIGAIGLQSQDTDFTLYGAGGTGPNGFVRKTGIFLYENGGVGTVQHVDLVT